MKAKISLTLPSCPPSHHFPLVLHPQRHPLNKQVKKIKNKKKDINSYTKAAIDDQFYFNFMHNLYHNHSTFRNEVMTKLWIQVQHLC